MAMERFGRSVVDLGDGVGAVENEAAAGQAVLCPHILGSVGVGHDAGP
jgi:hypothetical protein